MSSSSGVSFGGALALLFNNVCGPGVVALAPAFSDGGVTAAPFLGSWPRAAARGCACEAPPRCRATPTSPGGAARRRVPPPAAPRREGRAAGAVALFLSVAVSPSRPRRPSTCSCSGRRARRTACGSTARAGVCVRAATRRARLAVRRDARRPAGYAASPRQLPLGAATSTATSACRSRPRCSSCSSRSSGAPVGRARARGDRVPTVGDPASPAVAATVGTILFFGFVLTVPSVVGLKRRAARHRARRGRRRRHAAHGGRHLLAAVGSAAARATCSARSVGALPAARACAFLFAPARCSRASPCTRSRATTSSPRGCSPRARAPRARGRGAVLGALAPTGRPARADRGDGRPLPHPRSTPAARRAVPRRRARGLGRRASPAARLRSRSRRPRRPARAGARGRPRAAPPT